DVDRPAYAADGASRPGCRPDPLYRAYRREGSRVGVPARGHRPALDGEFPAGLGASRGKLRRIERQVGEPVAPHTHAGAACVNDDAVAGVDHYMAGDVDEVAPAKLALGGTPDRLALVGGVARHGDAEVAESLLHQARAIEPEKAAPAPQNRRAEVGRRR